MTSLICTHCARSSHLSCTEPSCQCPCRAQADFRAEEIARTAAEARESQVRTLAWIAVALALAVCSSAASVAGSPVLSLVLLAWTVPALWQIAVWGRAADDDADLIEWMGGRP